MLVQFVKRQRQEEVWDGLVVGEYALVPVGIVCCCFDNWTICLLLFQLDHDDFVPVGIACYAA